MTQVHRTTTITAELAQQIVLSAQKAAEKTHKKFAISVVDASGNLKAFLRQDGAKLNSVQISQDKAYSAASSLMSTQQWSEILQKDPVLAIGAPSAISRLTALGGGIPIVVGGEVIGAIGVSGAHWTDDVKIAKAGLSIVDHRGDS